MDRDYYEDIIDQVENLEGTRSKHNWNRFIVSTIIYYVSYNIMYIAAGLMMALVAYWIGFHPEYKFMGVYDLPTKTKDWHRWLILSVYGAIPFFGLVLGVLLYSINYLLREYNTILKVFFLWMGLHGLTFFGSYAVAAVVGTGEYDSPFYYGFAAISSWFHLDKPFMVPLTLFGLLFMMGCGFFFIRGFINLSFSRKVAINYLMRRKFLTQVLAGPWLVGSVMCIATVFLLRLEGDYDFNRIKVMMPHLVHHASILFLLIGTAFRLDYIISNIQVHSYDVFKGRLAIAIIALFATVVLIVFLQRTSIQF